MPISEQEARQSSGLSAAVGFGQPQLPVTAPPHYSRANDSPSTAQIEYASKVVNLTGCRLVPIDGAISIGVWEDLDGPELRGAFKTLGLGSLAVIHFEAKEVPTDFKIRQCPDRLKGESFATWLRRAEQEQAQRLARKLQVPA